MTSAGLRRAGGAFALVYVGVAVATFQLSTRPGRPLFDGFAPPVPYNWVKPPPELAADNFPPQGAERTIALGEQGSESANASTPDAQVLVTMPAGVIASHPPDTEVHLRLTPLDAGTLGPIPPDLRVVSNAYEVRLSYRPSEEPVTAVASNAQIALTGSSQGDGLLYSSDGTTWQQTQARPFGNTHGMTGPFQGNGYYVVTASPRVTTTRAAGQPEAGGGGGASTLVAAVVALVAGGVVLLGFRLRNRPTPARDRRRRR